MAPATGAASRQLNCGPSRGREASLVRRDRRSTLHRREPMRAVLKTAHPKRPASRSVPLLRREFGAQSACWCITRCQRSPASGRDWPGRGSDRAWRRRAALGPVAEPPGFVRAAGLRWLPMSLPMTMPRNKAKGAQPDANAAASALVEAPANRRSVLLIRRFRVRSRTPSHSELRLSSEPDQIRVQLPMKKSDHRIPCLRSLRCLR